MHRTVPNPTLPNPVRWATILWAVAIAAGITETSLAVAPGLADGGAVPWLALVTRALLYTFSALLVAWFARGHGWSRVTLVVLMTGVGLVSVLVSMGIGVLSGLGVFVGLGYEGHGVALLVRIAHTLVYVVAVVVATVAAFTPAANRYFRCSREDRLAAAGARPAAVPAPRGVSA
ncbi:hypothetical protein [Nocardiopsis metallicus]|uniref:Uncharacterized protein n=1 Tax=Nocardiopsis metallicus TaxID=179819 RepID=A0A840W9J7_9ACTN|nr:hypothetical protein [Nocardiopsis metallicus]MBB5493730.1 hypothetical protein [Nocardiopsis metallicus]